MYVKIPRNKIYKIEIITTNCKMTLQEVVSKYKCDYAINGGLYNMRTGKINSIPLRANGQTLATSQYGYWTLAWNQGPDMCMIHSSELNKWQNGLACSTMLKDGKDTIFTYTSEQDGCRGRSAIGENKNDIILYVTTDTNQPMWPKTLRSEMKKLGALDAIMLDSGGSSQLYADGTYLQCGQRKVAYWICVWLKDEYKTIIPNEKCPFPEPAVNIKYGSRGEGVKWLQWHLNKINNANLVVDGICGQASKMAIINFQKQYRLDPDGICGKMTRNKIKAIY